jgi:hypothetical protein
MIRGGGPMRRTVPRVRPEPYTGTRSGRCYRRS